MQREYDGEPLDMTWDSGPWANDGETVDATDSTNGTMTTIEWPDGATDPEELNDDQRKVIRTAARNLDVETMRDIQDIAGVDKNESYAAGVLREHWPEKHKILTGDSEGMALSDREIDKVRIALLNGESTRWLTTHFDVSQDTIARAAKGYAPFGSVDCKTPELEHTTGDANGQWILRSQGGESNTASKENISQPYPTATVDAWRKQALNGKDATAISDEYDHLWPADVAAALRGDALTDGEPTQPKLEWDNSSREWVTTELDAEQQTIESDTNTEGEPEPEPQPESEPTLEGQTVSKQPSVSTDSNVSKRAVAGVVAGVVAVVWLFRRIF